MSVTCIGGGRVNLGPIILPGGKNGFARELKLLGSYEKLGMISLGEGKVGNSMLGAFMTRPGNPNPLVSVFLNEV
jgi:hypothetical protein